MEAPNWDEGDMVMDKGKIQRLQAKYSCTGVQQGEGDLLECGSYQVIKLLEHGMVEVLERVLGRRLRG